jgi:hypothetical protein
MSDNEMISVSIRKELWDQIQELVGGVDLDEALARLIEEFKQEQQARRYITKILSEHMLDEPDRLQEIEEYQARITKIIDKEKGIKELLRATTRLALVTFDQNKE